jgi:hypothetical protein
MDSDEEMIQQIVDNEAVCNDDVREHLAVIGCLQKILDDVALSGVFQTSGRSCSTLQL